jgi:hypothetical protein
MTVGMSLETAFRMAISKHAWPIMTKLIWRSTDLFAEDRSLRHESTLTIPPLLWSIDESHLSRAECFDSSVPTHMRSSKEFLLPSGKYFSGCGLLIWVSSLYVFSSRGRLPGDERSSRFAPASYPILYPRLGWANGSFLSFGVWHTGMYSPNFSFGTDETTDKIAIGHFSLADREIDGWRSCRSARFWNSFLHLDHSCLWREFIPTMQDGSKYM